MNCKIKTAANADSRGRRAFSCTFQMAGTALT